MKILLFIISFLFLFVSSASAHVLEKEGSIGAVMHITPDDNPVAGRASGFFFEFKDRAGKFKPEQCECKFSVYSNGKEINSQNLFENNTTPSLDNASVYFTFPEKNVYTVTVSGKPIEEGLFQPFRLTYAIRVEKTASVSKNSSTTNWIGKHIPHLAVGLIIFTLVPFAVIAKRKEKKVRG